MSEETRAARPRGRSTATAEDLSSLVPEIRAKNLAYYRAMGAITIRTDEKTPQQVVDDILPSLGSPKSQQMSTWCATAPARLVVSRRLTIELELEQCRMESHRALSQHANLRASLPVQFPEVCSIHGEPSIERSGIEVVFEWRGLGRLESLLSHLSDEGLGTSFRTALHIHADCSMMTLEEVVGIGLGHPGGMTGLTGLRVTSCSLPWNLAIQEEFRTIISMSPGDPDEGRRRVWTMMTRHSSYKEINNNSFYSGSWGKNSAVNINPWLQYWFGLPKKRDGGGYGSIEFRAGFAASNDGAVTPMNGSTATTVHKAVNWVARVVSSAGSSFRE